MHTIQNTVVKISSFFFFAVLIGGCKKEGVTRLMDVEMKMKIVPYAERIKLGDTVKVIAWLPYQQYDRRTNSTVDIRGMEIKYWGNMGYMGLDSLWANENRDMRIYKFETFFEVAHPFGTFQNYPQNHIIGSMAQTDTAFYFELRLVARRPGVFKFRGGGGRGFLDKGRFQVDIALRNINPDYHQHLMQKYIPGANPASDDYFFETY